MGEAEDFLRRKSDEAAERGRKEARRIAQEVGPRIDAILPNFLELLRTSEYDIREFGLDRHSVSFEGSSRAVWEVRWARESLDSIYILADGTFMKQEIGGSRRLTYEDMGYACHEVLATLQDVLKRSQPPQPKRRGLGHWLRDK